MCLFSDNGQTATDSIVLEFNMSALSALLKKQSEQNPSASYFNVDILKYQVSAVFVGFTQYFTTQHSDQTKARCKFLPISTGRLLEVH